MRTGSGSPRVPAGALVALALVLLLAGFLLGRRTSPPVPTPAPSNPPVTQPATVAGSPATGEPAAHATEAAAPAPEPRAETPPATAWPTVEPTTAAPAPDARARLDIARYFEEADRIEARAKYWSDPQALAKTILEQAASGSTAGFDELIRAQARARDELARLPVPAECAEHHRRSLAVMADGLGLLERVRNALAGGDLGGLDGLQEQARGLEREAKAIDELGQALRQR